MQPPVITLLTDFGLDDHYVASMKGVMLTVAPEAVFVDITHSVTPYAILEAGYELAQAWRCFPAGTVHLVVVDPGVGSARRAIAAAAEGHRFVGPDNGVFTLALREWKAAAVREITAAHLFRQPVSSTFHGRDIFAPVAAHLAAGVIFEEIGPLVEDWVRLENIEPVQTGPNEWAGQILRVDRFGNAITNFDWRRFSWIAEAGFEISAGDRSVTVFRRRFSAAQDSEVFALAGSGGYIELACNQIHTARLLNLEATRELKLTRL